MENCQEILKPLYKYINDKVKIANNSNNNQNYIDKGPLSHIKTEQ